MADVTKSIHESAMSVAADLYVLGTAADKYEEMLYWEEDNGGDYNAFGHLTLHYLRKLESHNIRKEDLRRHN